MFALLTLGMFFIPANNQLLHSPGALFTLVVTMVLYLAFAWRFNGAAAPQFGGRRHGRGVLALRT